MELVTVHDLQVILKARECAGINRHSIIPYKILEYVLMLVSLEDTETKPPGIKGMAAMGFPGLKRKVKAFTIPRLKIH